MGTLLIPVWLQLMISFIINESDMHFFNYSVNEMLENGHHNSPDPKNIVFKWTVWFHNRTLLNLQRFKNRENPPQFEETEPANASN